MLYKSVYSIIALILSHYYNKITIILSTYLILIWLYFFNYIKCPAKLIIAAIAIFNLVFISGFNFKIRFFLSFFSLPLNNNIKIG